MTYSMSCLRSLRNLTVYSSSGSVRSNILQGLPRYYCIEGKEDQTTNLQRVAQQYKEVYARKQSFVDQSEIKDPKDRRNPIHVETSIRYLKSTGARTGYFDIHGVWHAGCNQYATNPMFVFFSQFFLAYKNTYGEEPVWIQYRRNFKGQIPPYHTRLNCVGSDGFLNTGNPCPICRDEYLILHYKNVELLRQFISPQHGAIYPYQKTNLCRTQHDVLLTAIMESMELGLLTYDLPFRVYNYDFYNPKKAASK